MEISVVQRTDMAGSSDGDAAEPRARGPGPTAVDPCIESIIGREVVGTGFIQATRARWGQRPRSNPAPPWM